MRLIGRAAATMLLAGTAAWGQAGSPSMATRAAGANSRAVVATSNAMGLAQNQQAQSAMHQRVEDMGNTLAKMHSLLKEMQAKNKALAKDPMTRANLEMWGLMLQDLDKQYEQLRTATRTREDMEARRAALYRQAEAKAAAEAQGKQPVSMQHSPAQDSPAQGAGSSSADPAAAPSTQAPTGAPANPSSPN
jgi:hypothetical protein